MSLADTVQSSTPCNEHDVKKLTYIEELTSLLEQQVASFEETLDRDISQLQSVHEYSGAILQQTAVIQRYKNHLGGAPVLSNSKENVPNTSQIEDRDRTEGVDRVSAEELEQLSKPTRGRLTVGAVNEYLDLLRRMVQAKSLAMRKDRRRMSPAEMKALEVNLPEMKIPTSSWM